MLVRKFHILSLFFVFVCLAAQDIVNYVPMTKPAETKFLDQEMSINMKNSDIKNVLMLIGDLTGLNIVISPDVKDTVTANLENVTVRTALDAILQPNGYSYFVRENIIIVKTFETEMVGELETVVVRLKYITANSLQSPIEAVMSTRGKMQSFMPLIAGGGGSAGAGDANIIVISDGQDNIPQIMKMIGELDKPIPNINIAVRFIETQLDTSQGIGIDWSQQPLQLGSTLDTSSWPISMNNMTIATLNPTQFISAMDIMEAEGRSKLLSSPQVTTLDNHQATTNVTTTVYIEGQVNQQQQSRQRGQSAASVYQQGSQGTANANPYGLYNPNQITEKSIGINLSVTPRINHVNKITLVVNASVEALLGAAEVSTDKPRSTMREVQTQVTVNDGDTVILGGLIAENTIENTKYVPILSSLPMVGRFFKSTSIEKEQRELLIFITPSIIG
jgi:type IV pilus assembly protein PilQ